MILAVHQPHFLPWLGYLNKAINADAFVWLDTIQYRKNYFQNRTRIMDADGHEQWLTVPVNARLASRIDEVTIADPRWCTRVEKTVLQCYRKTPHFEAVWPPLRWALQLDTDRLAEVNHALFLAVLDLLGWRELRLLRASELEVDAADPTDRLVALCRHVGASRYIAGRGGRSYMRLEAFAEAGVEVVWQEFDVSRTAYRRPGANGTIASGLSVLDSLCYLGPTRTAAIARDAWKVPCV